MDQPGPVDEPGVPTQPIDDADVPTQPLPADGLVAPHVPIAAVDTAPLVTTAETATAPPAESRRPRTWLWVVAAALAAGALAALITGMVLGGTDMPLVPSPTPSTSPVTPSPSTTEPSVDPGTDDGTDDGGDDEPSDPDPEPTDPPSPTDPAPTDPPDPTDAPAS